MTAAYDPFLFFACTTINASAKALEKNLRLWPAAERCMISFDRKTSRTDVPRIGARWIDFTEEPSSNYQRLCPWDSYSRKNIAFIEASKAGAKFIFETDDDNELISGYDELVNRTALFYEIVVAFSYPNIVNLFANIYRQGDENIWARGYPLRQIGEHPSSAFTKIPCRPGVIQFLVDGNPDVDAIFRLVRGADLDMQVDATSLPLSFTGSYHPFNSQATMWPREYFLLMYLPSSCPFRMTDIWRGYIAQRVLYEMGRCVVFDKPVVRQIRNEHEIHEDFFNELPGYEQSERVISTLCATDLSAQESVADSLYECYVQLCEIGIFEKRELILVQAWCEAMH